MSFYLFCQDIIRVQRMVYNIPVPTSGICCHNIGMHIQYRNVIVNSWNLTHSNMVMKQWYALHVSIFLWHQAAWPTLFHAMSYVMLTWAQRNKLQQLIFELNNHYIYYMIYNKLFFFTAKIDIFCFCFSSVFLFTSPIRRQAIIWTTDDLIFICVTHLQ